MDVLCALDNVCWGTFGDYSSYLELAFAINVIFVGWLTKIRRRFLRLRRAAERRQWRRLVTLTAQGVDAVDADELKDKVDAINAQRKRRNKVVSILDSLTRFLCFVLATTIILGLLLLGEEYEAIWVNWNWMSLAVALPLGTVALMAALEFMWSRRIDAHVNKAYDDALEAAGSRSERAEEIASDAFDQ